MLWPDFFAPPLIGPTAFGGAHFGPLHTCTLVLLASEHEDLLPASSPVSATRASRSLRCRECWSWSELSRIRSSAPQRRRSAPSRWAFSGQFRLPHYCTTGTVTGRSSLVELFLRFVGSDLAVFAWLDRRRVRVPRGGRSGGGAVVHAAVAGEAVGLLGAVEVAGGRDVPGAGVGLGRHAEARRGDEHRAEAYRPTRRSAGNGRASSGSGRVESGHRRPHLGDDIFYHPNREAAKRGERLAGRRAGGDLRSQSCPERRGRGFSRGCGSFRTGAGGFRRAQKFPRLQGQLSGQIGPEAFKTIIIEGKILSFSEKILTPREPHRRPSLNNCGHLGPGFRAAPGDGGSRRFPPVNLARPRGAGGRNICSGGRVAVP